MLNRKEFFGHAVRLAIPIMIQNLIGTLVNTADTVMLGYVSQEAMSAASLANQFTFVLFCFYFGLSTATSVLVAQYYGKDDKRAIEKVIGIVLRFALITSLIFTFIGVWGSGHVMYLFTNSPVTIELGREYIKIISLGFVFYGVSQVYTSALRSMGKVIIPSVVYIVSLCVNVCINAIFIFGLFGAPKMGVTGVAIGTVTARVVEFIICLVHSISSRDVKMRVKYIFEKAGVLLGDYVKIGAPSIGNDMVWSLATSVFAAILGHIGDDMVAANAVAIMVVNIGAVTSRGFSGATTIVVSQSLGADDIEEAKVYGGRMLWITIAFCLLGGGIIMLIRPFMMNFYSDKLSETAVMYLGYIMIMTTWRLLGEGINTCLICGCFRGGGDSKFGMICDTFFMWVVAVPLMAIGAYVLKLPPLWVYFIMSLDEFYKLPVVLIHYKKYNWLTNITRDEI